VRKSVKVAGATGFWGETPIGMSKLLEHPGLDFVVFDYLAEITMSIMARALFAERLGEKVHSSWTWKNYSAILDSVGQTEEAQIAAEKTRNILVCRNQYPSAISKPVLRSFKLPLCYM